MNTIKKDNSPPLKTCKTYEAFIDWALDNRYQEDLEINKIDNNMEQPLNQVNVKRKQNKCYS